MDTCIIDSVKTTKKVEVFMILRTTCDVGVARLLLKLHSSTDDSGTTCPRPMSHTTFTALTALAPLTPNAPI